MVENFLECYHCPTAHPGFSTEVDVHPDRYLLEAHPTFSSQYCKARSPARAASSTCSTRTRGSTSSPGRRTSRSARSSRTAPGRTERYLDYFFAPDVDAGWLAEFFAFDDQVGRRTRNSSSPSTAAWPPACSSGAACC